MIAYRDITSGHLRLFLSIEGEDLSGMEAVALPEDYDPAYHRWDALAGRFVEDWAALDAELLAAIDVAAGKIREQFITEIPGQQTTYQIKEREANSWKPGTSAAQKFPYLRLEAEAKGISIDDLVKTIKAYAKQWHLLNARIEAARTAAKDAVLAASSKSAKEAAAKIDWDAVINPAA